MNDSSDAQPQNNHPARPAAAIRYYAQPAHILLAGIALGLSATYLIVDGPAGGGPGFVAWLALLAGASLWLARSAGTLRTRTLVLWSAIALSAAVIMSLRDLDLLIPAMWLVILACAALTALQTNGMTLRDARFIDQLLAGFTLPLKVLTQGPSLLAHIDLQAHTRNPRLGGLLRGILLALPILAVFFALFASADAAFNSYAQSLTHRLSPATLQNLAKALVFSWIAASLLALATRLPQRTPRTTYRTVKLGTVEATVILSLVTALFALFVLLQLGYLFGGSATIESTSGLTLADYARRGFFELLIVGALTLALLLGLDATDCERRVLQRFGTTLVLFVLIILASAVQRMLLYTETFGLTIDRFAALGFLLWQAFNLASFALTVLRGHNQHFASGLAISAVVALLLLGLINPAAIVAKFNIERTLTEQAPLDVDYLMELGSDVVPVILEGYDELSAAEQCAVTRQLADPRLFPAAMNPDDWRGWNASQLKARRMIDARQGQLRRC
ncbi:MAG: hypothetical protein RLZZ227_1275 [Pseudomonadota bacterium]|jgi:hypothetical protein